MAQINIDEIPLYAPKSVYAIRLYNYLKKIAEAYPSSFLSREQLMTVATTNQISRNDAWLAIKELEQIVDCISFWDSTKRTVFYYVASMTPEEKLKRIDDAIWFESLD
jgi:hypothetical protein